MGELYFYQGTTYFHFRFLKRLTLETNKQNSYFIQFIWKKETALKIIWNKYCLKLFLEMDLGWLVGLPLYRLTFNTLKQQISFVAPIVFRTIFIKTY